mmetsp:Transcript_6967/g.17316  ORF Transcript_6967/g.17316 Transcript_6967/m.17316 type:complete len:200 (-) Transcript_6967:895-1494(-)
MRVVVRSEPGLYQVQDVGQLALQRGHLLGDLPPVSHVEVELGAQQDAQPAVGPVPGVHHDGDDALLEPVRVLGLRAARLALLVLLGHAHDDGRRVLHRQRHGLQRRPAHLVQVQPRGVAARLQLHLERQRLGLAAPLVADHDVVPLRGTLLRQGGGRGCGALRRGRRGGLGLRTAQLRSGSRQRGVGAGHVGGRALLVQ